MPIAAQAVEPIEIYTEQFPPYNYQKNDQLQGYAVELLAAMIKNANAPQSISDVRLYPWAKGYALLQSPTLKNMMFSMVQTSQRQPLFKWVGPIARSETVLFAKQNTNISIFSANDLSRYRFAAIRNSVGALLLGQNGVHSKNISQPDNFNSVIKTLNTGQADLFAYEKNAAHALMKTNQIKPEHYKVVYILNHSELYYAFNRSVDDATIKAYQTALDAVKKDKKLMHKLKNKYLN